MEDKKGILALLFQLCKTDNVYDIEEFMFMLEIGRGMGFMEEEIRSIQINSNDIDLTVPRTEHERMSIFYYVLFLMKADKKATIQEVNFVRKLGFQLGFGEKLSEELIQEIVRNIDQDINPENMIRIIIKHMN